MTQEGGTGVGRMAGLASGEHEAPGVVCRGWCHHPPLRTQSTPIEVFVYQDPGPSLPPQGPFPPHTNGAVSLPQGTLTWVDGSWHP